MSLLTSLFAGVSGLRNHQTMMDVIGNNVSNVNTIGFKSNRATFAEMFAQTRNSPFRPVGENGGINPIQIGLGTAVTSIDTSFTQGGLEATGQASDLGIQGSGFFIVKQDGKTYFTRVGTFGFDGAGNMVLPGTGSVLQGKLADDSGNIPIGSKLENLRIAMDKKSPAHPTTTIKYAGNLKASASPTDPPVSVSVDVFDSLGIRHSVTLTFTKTANTNEWSWVADVPAPATATGGDSGTITFDSEGRLSSFTYAGGATAFGFTPGNGASPMSVSLNPGTPGAFSGITQTDDRSVVTVRDQDGYTAGTLTNISVDKIGRIQGQFTNGTIITLGQIMLAEFTNPGGLIRTGNGLYDISGNTGNPEILSPGEGSRSSIVGGTLEQSNVDLAEEFTRMIVAQRGFQSNARVITTSDEILNEVVNLKR